jgi:DNA-binding LytR/AlgR family response regulator
MMPGGINGRMLANEAAIIRPDLAVLFTSGYTENTFLSEYNVDSDTLLLSKPYSRNELATKVRAAIEKRPRKLPM